MQTLRVDYPGHDLSFTLACAMAKAAACDSQMRDPTILSWHQHGTHTVSPCYDGIDPQS